MLDLSPVKILVVLVVALIVLGPDKLPQMARQLGAAWGDLRRFRTRLESDVRGAFPDLPATHEVAQAVRSPLAFLDRLADEHEKSRTAAAGEVQETTDLPVTTETPAPLASNGNSNANGNGANGGAGMTEEWYRGADGPPAPIELDDPSMN
jgi:sec-independent protein translocase protein TatB